MNKTELIACVAEKNGMTKRAAAGAVESVFDAITEEVKNGQKVTVTGFGTFEPRVRAARQGRNPQTGEAITISAHTAVAFRAGKGLKDIVNE